MSNEWKKWEGGECPVHPNTVVEVCLRGSSELVQAEAQRWFWEHGDLDGNGDSDIDIIAYRVVKEAPQEPEQPTLRDQFAMAALTGLLPMLDLHDNAAVRVVTSSAYVIADAMLAARQRGHRSGGVSVETQAA
ncbi:MAG: hypothetical protein ACU85V_00195 [Gammaproteobacteria bacterium]